MLSAAIILIIATLCRPTFALARIPPAEMSSSTNVQSRNWGDVQEVRPDFLRLFLKDDGVFPNNPNHPLLLFRDSFQGSQEKGSQLLIKGGWTSPWVWGVFTYHHYHSTAWEILVCVEGWADIQFGGPSGPTIAVKKGDVALVPPGVAHKQLNDQGGFALLLGAYPVESPHADTIRGLPSERQRRHIVECFTPESEPITGTTLDSLY
jgi:uncharacterized protein YjlB